MATDESPKRSNLGHADWSIQEIARLAKTTSRTLRHYDEIGLLPPSRIGSNGYRYYGPDALVRLQRILLLRDLGLGLAAIAEVLDNESDVPRALRNHLAWLHGERERLARQIASVTATLTAIEGEEELMAENMFDGFDHTQYRQEVEERWGKDAYAKSDAWWRSKSEAEKKAYHSQHADIARDYAAARERGADAGSDEVQAIAKRHWDWLSLSAEVTGGPITSQRFVGYGEMYAADPRFAANYGGQAGAAFVRDAMRAYAERNL